MAPFVVAENSSTQKFLKLLINKKQFDVCLNGKIPWKYEHFFRLYLRKCFLKKQRNTGKLFPVCQRAKDTINRVSPL